MTDVVVVGSLNLDLVVSTSRIPAPGETVTGGDYAEHPGGKGLNQAVAAARSDARVAMVGCVGRDAAADTLLGVLVDDDIDHSGVHRIDDAPTGRAAITVDAGGENSIVVVPGANARVERHVVVPPATVVLLQLEIPLATVTEVAVRASAAGSTVVLNPAPAVDLPDQLLAACDVVVPNEHEIDLIGGVERLRAVGVGTVIVTRGADGVTVHDDGGDRSIPAHRVDPVDTTGAGDAFCGSLGARLALGDGIDDAIAHAVVAGALATTRRGAVPSLPRHDEIRSSIGSI